MKTNIKAIKKTGARPGKTTVILAGVHGNEICGIKAFDSIIPKIRIKSGKVIFIYANLKAIKQSKRQIEKNLNRCFYKNQPIEIKGKLEGKTAKEIIPYLDSADFMLDIHASFTKDTKPFVICDKKQLGKANIFDSKIVTYNWDSFEPGSTDYYMNQKNKPGFCFECGYSSDEKSIEIAKKIIINFLVYTKNIPGTLFNRNNQKFFRIKSIYKNKDYQFKKSRFFRDFEKADKKTIVGYENSKPIIIEKNDIILFLKDSENLNEECFLTAEEINKETLINQGLLNIKKEKLK
jgi:succinylglutamate desuccinylase